MLLCARAFIFGSSAFLIVLSQTKHLGCGGGSCLPSQQPSSIDTLVCPGARTAGAHSRRHQLPRDNFKASVSHLMAVGSEIHRLLKRSACSQLYNNLSTLSANAKGVCVWLTFITFTHRQAVALSYSYDIQMRAARVRNWCRRPTFPWRVESRNTAGRES
jgi:hypothetical protein